MTFNLSWLRPHPDFDGAIAEVKIATDPRKRLQLLRRAAGYDLDTIQIADLDRQLIRISKESPETLQPLASLKLAILCSFTIDHVLSSIRVAALRRGLRLEIYSPGYGQARQVILDPRSDLYAFAPDVALLAAHAYDVGTPLSLRDSRENVAHDHATRLVEWEHLWSLLKDRGMIVVQQTMAIPPQSVFGHLDAQIQVTPANQLRRLNEAVLESAAKRGVLVLDMDFVVSYVGSRDWWDFPFWYHAKHAVPLSHSAWYADHVARILASIRGLSAKCLVLDLDNTLWGGVIGDDGLAGIQLGQGNAVGEAFLAFQRHVKSLRERGVILAVCSKNDEAVARTPFENHPDTILRLDDFSVFVANWDDKATNLRRIAARLNIGLDAIVFSMTTRRNAPS